MKKTALIVTMVLILSVCLAACSPAALGTEEDRFIHSVIMDRGQSSHTGNAFPVENHKVMKISSSGDRTTVYMWVLYVEYVKNGDTLYEQSGWHIPAALTYRGTDGGFELLEYWEPRDGAYYPKDIRRKFPPSIRYEGMNSQLYIDEQLEACREKAELHFSGMTT